MMRASKVLTGVVASVALTVGGLTATTAPAQADTPGCVSKREFHKVKRGFPMYRVHRIFDTKGTQTYYYTIGGVRYQGRDYRVCTSPEWGWLSVDFKKRPNANKPKYRKWRVTDKFAYWG